MTLQEKFAERMRPFPAAPLSALVRNKVLLIAVACHFAVTLAASGLAGVPYDPGMLAALSELFYGLLPIFLATVVIARFIAMLRHERPEKPIAWMIADLRQLVSDRTRVVDGIVTLLGLSVFTGCYGFFKEIIPYLHAYTWDPALARLDWVIHGGADPGLVLLHVFNSPYVVSAFNITYQGWFFVMFFMVFLAAFTTGDRASRNTFLLGFVLAWSVGGNIIATIFASAGPCYYARLGFGHDYDALTSTLAAFSHVSPNWSLDVQQWLWEGYLGKGQIRGISAFPSMHVTSTTILMLYGWRRGRAAGVFLTLFWAMICISAVMLAWHYAVDVYAGWACGLLFWWLAAMLTGDRAFRRPQDAAKYRSAGT